MCNLVSHDRDRHGPVPHRSVLVIIFHLLADPEARYHDLGPDFYDNRISRERKIRNHVRQLQALGLTVTLTPAEDAA